MASIFASSRSTILRLSRIRAEQGQETDTENKERGGGLRALDGNEGGRNAACQEAAKINLIYIILCNIQS